jgi:hypothetical protein
MKSCIEMVDEGFDSSECIAENENFSESGAESSAAHCDLSLKRITELWPNLLPSERRMILDYVEKLAMIPCNKKIL